MTFDFATETTTVIISIDRSVSNCRTKPWIWFGFTLSKLHTEPQYHHNQYNQCIACSYLTALIEKLMPIAQYEHPLVKPTHSERL